MTNTTNKTVEAVAKAIKRKVHSVADDARLEGLSLYDIDIAAERIAQAAISAHIERLNIPWTIRTPDRKLVIAIEEDGIEYAILNDEGTKYRPGAVLIETPPDMAEALRASQGGNDD